MNHLSEKEFYYQLEALKRKQKELKNSVSTEFSMKQMYDFDKDDETIKVELHKNRDISSKTPPVRFNLKEYCDDDYKRNSSSKAVRISSGKSCATSLRSSTPFWNLSDDDDDVVTSMAKSLRCKSSSPNRTLSPSKLLTVPKPFKMTQREEEDRMLNEMAVARRILSPKENEKSTNDNQFKANPVPLTSKIPLYKHIVEEQEHR